MTIEDFLSDDRRNVYSKMVRLVAGSPSNQSWRDWRRLVGVPDNVQMLTRLEMMLLICRGHWQAVKTFHGFKSRQGPSYMDLIDYGKPWFIANAAKVCEGFSLVLQPGDDGLDPTYGVAGRDLAKAIAAITGKTRCMNTIRSCCLKLRMEFHRGSIYRWEEILKIAENL